MRKKIFQSFCLASAYSSRLLFLLVQFFLIPSLLTALPWNVVFSAPDTFRVPVLTSPVVDEAGILRTSTQSSLESALRALASSGGSQVNVLTLKSLGGLEIEQASIKIVDQWKLGEKKTDKGVLLLIAPHERKLRIEVGQGLEGVLTDADSKRIIDQAIVPLIRKGDFDSAVLVGVFQIVKKTDPQFDVSPYLEGKLKRRPKTSGDSDSGGIPVRLWFIIAIVLFFLFFGGRGRRGGGIWYGGGGGGFGGGGGGGWSGGGGGFSGGGASGDW